MDVVTAALNLATEIAKYINTSKSRQYVDELAKLQKERLDEEAKGQHAIDSKLESLHARIALAIQNVQNELLVSQKR